MIYTFTANPSLDYHLKCQLEDLDNHNLRSEEEYYRAGGKGVNVSIVLNALQVPSTCLGFLGGFIRDYYLYLLKPYKYLKPLFTSIEGLSRINLKLEETSINARGPIINQKAFDKLTKTLNTLYENDYLIVSGNVQDSISNDLSNSLREIKDINLVIDSDFEYDNPCFLRRLDAYDKVNVKTLLDAGTKYILINDNNYIYLFSKHNSYVYKGFEDVAITGFNDSLIAGFIYGCQKGANGKEAFVYALSCALDLIHKKGLELMVRADIEMNYETLLKEIKDVKEDLM